VGLVVDDSNSSNANTVHCGGVFRTVRVVDAVEVASAFMSSFVPALKRKASIKTAKPAIAVNIVIFPALFMNLGRVSALNDILMFI
jgi:hypothetical protein